MASVISEREKEDRREAVKLLKKQIETERLLVAQYQEYGAKVANLGVQRMLHMIMFDSQKHIEALQAAIDNIEGHDILKEDRRDLREGLQRHIELEMESIKAAEEVLKYSWLKNTKGLKELIEGWRDDEKRHHQTLKKLSEKPFIHADPNDFSTLFKSDEEIEERYLRSKRLQKKLKETE
jgi:bacterioferritin (cytochrome b1)